MWIVASIGLGVIALAWLAKRTSSSSHVLAERASKRAQYELAALRCDLETAINDAARWFAMDLPKPAWDSISDAFSLLEALRPRIDREEWSALQVRLLAAIPQALDARPRPTLRSARSRPVRRIRRRSRGLCITSV